MKKLLLIVTMSMALGMSSLFIQSEASSPIALDEAIAEFQSRDVSFEVIGQPAKMGFASNYSVPIKLITFAGVTVRARGQLSGSSDIGTVVVGDVYSTTLKFRPPKKATRQGFEATAATKLEKLSSAVGLTMIANQ